MRKFSGIYVYPKKADLITKIEKAKGSDLYPSSISDWYRAITKKPTENKPELGSYQGKTKKEEMLDLISKDTSASNEAKGEAGTYGQNVWGDAKASGTVEGLGIGEDVESGDVDTGRRKRRGTKTSAGLGI